jgi:GcrA cell cycle regulator
MASVWNDEAKSDELRKLYNQGLSCRQIAVIMNCGLSRNAIIGKVHRLGLERRGRSPGPRKSAKVKNDPLVKRTRLVRSNSNSTALRLIHVNEPTTPGALRCVEVESRRLTLLELEPNDCRYPDSGGGPDHTFCGLAKLPGGSSYCPSHFVLAKGKSYQISSAEHERRRRHFMGLNRQSVKAMGVWA